MAHATTKRLSQTHTLLGMRFEPSPPERRPTRTFTDAQTLDARPRPGAEDEDEWEDVDETIAANPTKDLDPTWGKGFLQAKDFVAIVYSTLK